MKKYIYEGMFAKLGCWEALRSLGSNMSPENNYPSKEFCVCFSTKFAHIYLKLSVILSKDYMSNSQRHANVTFF